MGNFARLAVFETVRVGVAPDVLPALAATFADPDLPGSAVWRSAATPWAPLEPATVLPADALFRVVLDPARYSALAAEAAGVRADVAPACVTLDVARHRPQVEREEAKPLSVVLGAWTEWPSSPNLAPPRPDPGPDATGRAWSAGELSALLDDEYYAKVLGPLARAVPGRRFAPPIYERAALPTTCYVVVPEGAPPGSSDEWFAPGPWRTMLASVTKDLLGIVDLKDARLAATVREHAGVVTLYRHLDAPDRSWPVFLFLPSGPWSAAGFETEVVDLARSLDFLDSFASYQQWDAVTDLEMVIDRIGDFRLVTDEAADALNPLLLALAAPRAEGVEGVQSAVELVRTVLAQSGPELIVVEAMIERQRNAGEALKAMGRQYSFSAGQRSPDGMTRVEDLLVDNRFQPVTYSIERAMGALAALAPLREVIRETISILAERREQTLARLESTGHALNVALGVLAGAAAIDLLVHFDWEETWGWVDPVLRAVTMAVFAVLVGWVVRQRRAARGRGVGASHELVSLRDDLVGFLQRTGSGRDVDDGREAAVLAGVMDRMEQATADLAVRAAALADDDHRGLLHALVDRAELWSCRALLVAERPFPLPSSLPLVTCLLHFREGGRFVSPFEFRNAMPGLDTVTAERFRQAGCDIGPGMTSTAELLAAVEPELTRLRAGPLA